MHSKMTCAVIGSFVLLYAGMAQATSVSLLEGGSATPALTAVTLPGTVVATETEAFTGTDYSGTLVSTVISGDATNLNGGLTFTYQVFNDAGSTGIIDVLQLPGFTGFLTDVGEQSSGVTLFGIYRGSSAGDPIGVVDFRWPSASAILPGGNSQLLVVQTDAAHWTDATGTLIDGSYVHTATYGPTAVPLPPAVLLGIPGLLGAVFIGRKRRVRVDSM